MKYDFSVPIEGKINFFIDACVDEAEVLELIDDTLADIEYGKLRDVHTLSSQDILSMLDYDESTESYCDDIFLDVYGAFDITVEANSTEEAYLKADELFQHAVTTKGFFGDIKDVTTQSGPCKISKETAACFPQKESVREI